MQETWVQPGRALGQEDPLEKGMATTPVFLPRKFHGQRSLAGYSLWGRKDSAMTERLSTSEQECTFGTCEQGRAGISSGGRIIKPASRVCN